MSGIRDRVLRWWSGASRSAKTAASAALVLVIIGGTFVATNEDAKRVLSDATSLSVVSGAPVISDQTGEPAVLADPAFPDKPPWYVRGADNKLWLRKWDAASNAWQWQSQNGQARSAPAVVKWADTTFVFEQGDDGNLYYKKDKGTVLGWQTLGGNITSSPAATPGNSFGGKRVYARRSDNRFWFREWFPASATWSEWIALPDGYFSSAPSVIDVKGLQYVFGRGLDNALYVRRDGLADDPGWKNLGGVFTSSFAVVELEGQYVYGQSFVGGQTVYDIGNFRDLIVLGRGTDNAMWYRRLRYSRADETDYAPSSWTQWTSTGGYFTSGPSTFSFASSAGWKAYAYGRGSDGRMYRSEITWTPNTLPVFSLWNAIP